MRQTLEALAKRYEQLNEKMGDPSVVSDRVRFEKLAREHAELRDVAADYARLKKLDADLAGAKAVVRDDADPEMVEMAEEEVEELTPKVEALERSLRLMLLPKDPNDDKNVILEIRAGTGGDEAGLFAADLFRMYGRYAEEQKWKVEILSCSETGVGGFKEIICSITGKGAYSRLKYESGVHRVQRVPDTETQGRIHTSAVTVAILPEAEEVEVDLDPSDLKIDIYRSSGPGGQSVNTTDSAVRITHIPTGLVVSMQDEKSQHKNKAKGMRVLLSRLQDLREREEADKRGAARKSQVGSGDRSERIRTYNFPQGRVSDHRINLTLYKLEAFINGALDEMIDALNYAAQEKALKEQGVAAG